MPELTIRGEAQPLAGPSLIAYITEPKPTPANAKPTASKRPGCGSRCSWRETNAEQDGGRVNREVQVEDPPPRKLGDEQPTDHRTEGGRASPSG